MICDGLGDLETEWRKDLPAAFKWYSEYATLASEMVQHDERNAEWLRELAVAKKNLATTHLRMGKQDLAQTLFGEAISVRRNLVSADPTNHKNARELCLLLLDYCDTLTQLGKREDTLSILAECQTMCRQKYTEDAGEAWWENREISIWYRLAINQWGIGRSLAKANPEKPDFDYLKTVSGYLESAAIRSKELKSANRLTPTGIRESEKCAALLPAVKSSLESPLEREIPPSKDKN